MFYWIIIDKSFQSALLGCASAGEKLIMYRYVFQKFDPEGARGKVSRRDFRSAIYNIERSMADDRKLGPVLQYLDESYSGDIDYRRFVESVMAVTNQDRPIGVVEEYARRQEAVRQRMGHQYKEG